MKNRYFTLWLALICVVFFVFQLLIPGFTDSLLLNQNALHGEVWRFVTSIFLHASFIHILLNMFALLLFGLILESRIGSNRFLLVFLASGVIANIVAVFFYPSSLGASGAIYGILGVLTIIVPTMVVFVYSLPLPMFIAAIVFVGASVFGILNPTSTGDIAHLSGIIVGLAFGVYYRIRHLSKMETRADYSRVGMRIPEHEIRAWEDTYMRK